MHPDRQLLQAHLEGDLPPATQTELQAHLSTCLECQATAAQLESAHDSFAAALRDSAREGEVSVSPECDRAMAAALSLAPQSAASITADDPTTFPRAADLPAAIRDYEILAKLGEGGMGAVYKARHRRLKKVVALKLVSEKHEAQAQALSRFEREMEAVGQLDSPHIVAAHDAGFDASSGAGQHYLVMEYVEGLDLSQLVRRVGPLPAAEACELIRQAAVGLQHAHERGMVHRDIKPSNLMLTRHGVVKILDLGLALLPGQQEGRELTSTGQVMGTFDYMAPEQGGNSHDVDIRADLYSLGATLYKLLSGEAPFGGEKYTSPMRKLTALALEQPPSIRARRKDLPDAVVALLDRLLAKSPDDRYATPAELAAALAPLAKGADLAGLISRASQEPSPATAPSISTSSLGTAPGRSSALDDTDRHSPAKAPSPIAAPGVGGDIPWWRTPSALAGGAAAIFFALYGIWLIIRDRDGNETARVPLKPGDTIEVANGGDPKKLEVKPMGALPKLPGGNEARPGATTVAAPLSATAWTQRPASLPGVKSWTVETVGHRGRIYEAKFSPDGKFLATAGGDGTVRICDGDTGEEKAILLGHNSMVYSIAWAPDSRRLASVGDTTLRIWDVVARKQLLRVEADEGLVHAVDWTRDGKKIATLGKSGELKTWTPQGKLELTQQLEIARVDSRIAWSPDGKEIAAGGYSSPVLIVSISDKAVIRKIPDSGGCDAFVWSEGGNRLAGFGQYATAVYDVKGNVVLRRWSVGELEHWREALTILLEDQAKGSDSRQAPVAIVYPYGHWIVAIRGDGRKRYVGFRGDVQLISTSDATKDAEKTIRPAYHPFVTTRSEIAPFLSFSLSGEKLAYSGRDDVVVWDVSDPTRIRRLNEPCTGMAWSQDESLLLVLPMDGRHDSFFFDAKTWFVKKKMPITSDARVEFTANGSALFIAQGSQSMLFDTKTGKANVTRMTGESPRLKRMPRDSGYLVFGPRTNTLVFTPDGNPKQHAITKVQNIQACAFSPDANHFAAVVGRKLSVFETATADLTELFEGWSRNLERDPHDRYEAEDVAWIAGSNRVAVMCGDLCLRIFDRDTGKCVQETRLPEETVKFAPGGKSFVNARDNELRLYLTEGAKPFGTLVQLRDDGWLAIGPDGHWKGSDLKKDLRYVALLDDGTQQIFTPAEFEKRFGWKNDPEKVKITQAEASPRDSHRALAEWALEIGARELQILRDGKAVFIRQDGKDLAPLPAGDFRVSILILDGRPVRDDDLARFIPIKDIHQLWLRETDVTDRGIAHLKHCSLDGLFLQGTKVTDAVFDSLVTMPRLGRLFLDRTGITRKGMDRLKDIKKLYLVAVPADFGDQDIPCLVACADLAQVDFEGIHITDAGMPEIARVKSLRRLTLIGTEVSDEGLRALEGLSMLEFVQTQGSKVTDAGRARLRAKLPKCEVK